MSTEVDLGLPASSGCTIWRSPNVPVTPEFVDVHTGRTAERLDLSSATSPPAVRDKRLSLITAVLPGWIGAGLSPVAELLACLLSRTAVGRLADERAGPVLAVLVCVVLVFYNEHLVLAAFAFLPGTEPRIE
jgi:hypothetical protein